GNGLGGNAELLLKQIGGRNGKKIGGTATGEEDLLRLEFLERTKQFPFPGRHDLFGFPPGLGLPGDFPVSVVVVHPNSPAVFSCSFQPKYTIAGLLGQLDARKPQSSSV